ncbi:diguanylate cyclase domain-containing protein [Caenimonas terrae]|uniref:diguanylate cyclase domain-containing protein n=1 Tax=Caenimonas terrae TaxID=696074 RepID=UPI00367314F4
MEITIWSLALGAIGAIALGRAVDLAIHPTPSVAHSNAFHLAVLGFVAVLSGLPEALAPDLEPDILEAVQVMAGPLCVGLSAFLVGGWLNARHRERLMAGSLRLAALVAPLAALACFALPAPQRLPLAGAVSLLAASLTLWAIWRASLMGDRLASAMAFGCLLTLPAIGGMYATAIPLPGVTAAWEAGFAVCAALANGLIGYVLWRRDQHDWQARHEEASSDFDPVTRLHTGVTLGQRLVKAQLRRRRMKHDGAVLAVMVFNIDRVRAQAGPRGVNDMFIRLAGRIQRQVGVVNPVGRYYDSCFVCLVESIDAPVWLRTLGLRVACSLRRPVEVGSSDGQRLEVHPDIGVGIVHLTAQEAHLDEVLNDAERMAEAARATPSRTAMLDPQTGRIVPVEQAQLAVRRIAGARHHGARARPMRH